VEGGGTAAATGGILIEWWKVNLGGVFGRHAQTTCCAATLWSQPHPLPRIGLGFSIYLG